MATFRRLSGDAVALGAAGLVVGTALAALGAPSLPVLASAAGCSLLRVRGRGVLCASLLAGALLAGARGVGMRAEILDPLDGTRDRLLRPLVAAIPGEAGALAAGLTLGESRYFSRAFRDAMRASATTHLVALSGFNVMLVLGFARRLFRLWFALREEALLGVLFLAAFVALAGLQPSLLRAAIMGTALLVAQLAGRRVAPARLLLLAAALILLYDPRLATHLGFILSFISSWALMAIFGDVERFLATGMRLGATIRRVLVPTLVAQLGVAPALLATVGSVSLIGLAVNPVAIAMTPFLTALSGATLLLAHAAPPLAALLGPLAGLAGLPAIAAITLAARLPLEVAVAVPAWAACVLYAGSVLWSLKRKPELW